MFHVLGIVSRFAPQQNILNSYYMTLLRLPRVMHTIPSLEVEVCLPTTLRADPPYSEYVISNSTATILCKWVPCSNNCFKTCTSAKHIQFISSYLAASISCTYDRLFFSLKSIDLPHSPSTTWTMVHVQAIVNWNFKFTHKSKDHDRWPSNWKPLHAKKKINLSHEHFHSERENNASLWLVHARHLTHVTAVTHTQWFTEHMFWKRQVLHSDLEVYLHAVYVYLWIYIHGFGSFHHQWDKCVTHWKKLPNMNYVMHYF